MKSIDRLLQRWRIAKARRFIKPGARILDIGSAEGALFRQLKISGAHGMGIDPTLKSNSDANGVPLIAGFFPKDLPATGPFDVITMLAVLEHFPPAQYGDLRRGCVKFLRLIDGMSLEEHHGYEVGRTVEIFPAEDFRLLKRATFQLGLNNLFVFERVGKVEVPAG